MPNHITNRIELFGTEEQIKEVLDKYSTFYPETPSKSLGGEIVYTHKETGKYGWLDEKTNKFQMGHGDDKTILNGVPEDFEIDMERAFTRFPDFDKVLPMPKAVEASFDEGGISPLWYSWSNDNWGTKWNSYSHIKVEDNIFIFQTAWSAVPKILEEISLNFPDVEIHYEWADEDTSYNTGTILLKNGIIDVNLLDGGSKEAYELFFKLRPDDKKYYKLVDGNYEYDEDEE